MTRTEAQTLYDRLLASSPDDGVDILAEALRRARVNSARRERSRIAGLVAAYEGYQGAFAPLIRSRDFDS